MQKYIWSSCLRGRLQYDACVDDVHSFNPQCSSISWSSGISCGYTETEDCTDGWTSSYRCYGSYLQRLYLERVCGSTDCVDDENWENYEYCGADSCGSCGSNYCQDNDVYHSRTCHDRGCASKSCFDNTYTEEKKVQECGTGEWTDEYRCSGSMLQRKWINRGCSGSSCSETEEWKDYQECGIGEWTDEYRCSGNMLQRKWVDKGCSDSSCYTTEEWKNYQDCGIDSCDSWSSNYCKDNDVYHEQTCYERGCASGACYENPSVYEDKVEECGTGTWLNEYRCFADWRQRKWINRSCSGSSCYTAEEWKNYQDCKAFCFPSILSQGCQGGTYTCQGGACGFPLQFCSPPLYTSSGVACGCNTEQGTIIKACNGLGICLNTEEKCHVDCGADLVCQGLKPGDEYPGDPSKICCRGEQAMPDLPEWSEVSP